MRVYQLNLSWEKNYFTLNVLSVFFCLCDKLNSLLPSDPQNVIIKNLCITIELPNEELVLKDMFPFYF